MAAKLIGRDAGRVSDEMLADVDIVSFDMFDTLVYRCCDKPADVFEIAERRYNRESERARLHGFRSARIEAERAAREASAAEEVTFREIYDHLPVGFQSMADELMALELDTELALCRPIPETKALFEKAVRLGKLVVIVSDMYLPRKAVEGILANCGYRGQCGVFVSSEFGLTKRSGHLFEAVAAGLGVDAGGVLHIGDHPVNDFLAAGRVGLNAFLCRRPVRKTRLFRPWGDVGAGESDVDALELGAVKAIAEEGLRQRSDIRERFGFSVLGPMLLGYSTWLHALVEKQGADSLWFLSREGHILREAYLTLYPDDADASRYVNVSRVALCAPVAAEARDYDELMELLSCLANSVRTVGDLCSVLGLESPDALLEFGLADDDELSAVGGNRLYDAVQRHGRRRFSEQGALAREYLEAADPGGSDVIICDIGWAGTMQALLQRLLPSRRFTGAYLAVSDFHDAERGVLDRGAMTRYGYWCGSAEWGDRGQAIRFVQSAAETLFLNDEGTTIGYRREGLAVVPVKDESLRLSETRVSAGLLDEGAMSFVAECARAQLPRILGEVGCATAMLPFLNAVTRGSADAVGFYGHFKFIDGARVVTITPEHGLAYYLLHPRAAFEELQTNNSKVLWLRGVFKLPLPYFGLLRLLTSKAGMKSEYARAIGRDGA